MQSLRRVPGRCVMAVRLMQAPLPWLPEGAAEIAPGAGLAAGGERSSAGGLTLAPYPGLPEGAAEIAPGVGLASGDDGSGTVWVHGMATFCWEAGDEACRRLAAVQLTELKAATQKQVAAGFGTSAVTVWRWADAYRKEGLAERKGPKGPSKLTPELTGQIRQLRGQGLSQAAVAAPGGGASFAGRTAPGPVRARTAPAAAGEEPAGQEPSAGGGGWEQESLPVLPDPVPRDGERAAARFGLLGEGAVPVFAPGARYPLAGLLLALPALEQAGLLAVARQVYGRIRNGFY